jgi:N-acetylneuraminic acid mutarotase
MKLNKLLLLIAFTVTAFTLRAQTNEWAWMSGSNVIGSNCSTISVGTYCGQPGVFGTLGQPATANHPSGHSSEMSWVGKDGTLWIFGGNNFDKTGAVGFLDDLWKFDPSSSEWTWMAGTSQFVNYCAGGFGCIAANYGTQGVAAATNTPGGRTGSYTWTDASGNLWLFGGMGYGPSVPTSNLGYFNDLWKFDITLNQWIWIGGSSSFGAAGVYGTPGTPSTSNIPGARSNGFAWTDSNGKLWLFGGIGYDANDCSGFQNDLWLFDPVGLTWTWLNGSNAFPTPCNPSLNPTESGSYGTKGVASTTNLPIGRDDAQGWSDTSGNLWLYGGLYGLVGGQSAYPNDLWQYNTSTKMWTWVNGSDTVDSTNQVPYVDSGVGNFNASNTPGSQTLALSAFTSNGDAQLLLGASYPGVLVCDQWEYDPSTNEWALMVAQFSSCNGVYGQLGTPAAANFPGYRIFSNSFQDHNGNMWIFGGIGADSLGANGYLNDLWEYLPANALVTPTLNWNPATPITNPAPLNSAQFNANVLISNTNLNSDGAFTYYVGPVANNVIATTSTILPVGTDQLCVQWVPNSSNSSTYNSVSGCANIVVNNPGDGTTATALTADVNPVFVSNTVTLTAVVTSGNGTPAGTVTFYLQNPISLQFTPLATVALDSTGTAKFQIAFGDVGLSNLKAVYSGNSSFNTSTSSVLGVLVEDFKLSSSSSIIILPPSQTAKYVLTVSPVAPATTLAQDITFSFEGMPPGVTWSATAATVKAGSGTTLITVTFNSPIQAAAPPPSKPGAPIITLALTLFSAPFIVLFGRRRKHLNRWLRILLLAVLTGVIGFSFTGCNSLLMIVQSPVTVKGTSVDLVHSTSFNMIVN